MKKSVLEQKNKFLSHKVGNLEDDIRKFKQTYLRLWWETGTDFPLLNRIYNKTEQKKIENELSGFVDEVSVKFKDYSPEKDKQKIWLEDLITGLKKSGKQILELSDVYLDTIFNEGFINSTRMFIENVKKFDPSLKIEDIYQALRNVWIMNSLQIYLDLDIKKRGQVSTFDICHLSFFLHN